MKGMLDRLTRSFAGRVMTVERLQPEAADRSLCAAHALIIHVLGSQVEHFELDAAPYERVKEDFLDIWKQPQAEAVTGT